MLDDAVKSTIQDAYRQWLGHKGVNARYGQRLMIAEIAKFIASVPSDDEGHRVGDKAVISVEAGTGTGKTLAYLLAVLPLAQALEKTVVVATATIALQEQVTLKDLPDLQKHSGLDFSYSLAKGRGRYLCLSKIDSHLQEQHEPSNLALYPDEQAAYISSDKQALYQTMLDKLGANQWDGDRDSWPEQIDDDAWIPLTARSSECSGRHCPYVSECVFFKARDHMLDVDCVISNHDLVLSDLALGGGAILPPPEDTIYIFDEAHHLGSKALQHFSSFANVQSSLTWLGQLEKNLAPVQKQLGDVLRHTMSAELYDRIEEIKQLLADVNGALQPMIETVMQAAGEGDGFYQADTFHRFEHGALPEAMQNFTVPLKQHYEVLINCFTEVHENTEKLLQSRESAVEKPLVEQAFVQFGQILSRLQSEYGLWLHFASSFEKPQARWLTLKESSRGFDIGLHASPVLASHHLQRFLWSRCYATVLTSATLTGSDGFTRFAEKLGLDEQQHFVKVPSPFDYRLGKLYIADFQHEPNQYREHTQEIIDLMPELLSKAKGTLVLFTSRRQMRDVYEGLHEQDDWQQTILMQDSLPKQEIVKQHCKAVDSGAASVIFGLASFAEGIDLPGKYCQHVVITRIPFAVPNDPIEATLAEWIESQGGNPFMQIAVPEASMRLIQAMGRLIRTETDTGLVSVLDKRMVTKFYGKQLLQAIPPFTRVQQLPNKIDLPQPAPA